MREMGLGTAAGPGAVTLADARVKARWLHDAVREGRDPLADRAAADAVAKANAARSEPGYEARRFREVADDYLAAHEISWRNAASIANTGGATHWSATPYPHMGALPIAEVDTTHVMAALSPIWQRKPETASRLRGRIEAVLDYGKSTRMACEGKIQPAGAATSPTCCPNGARPKRLNITRALPWRQIGAFMPAE